MTNFSSFAPAAGARLLRLLLAAWALALLPGLAQAQAPTVGTPTPGNGEQGSTFVLSGTALTGTTSVLLGEAPARFVVNSDTQLTVTVPPGSSTQKVRVTNHAGTALSAAAFGVDKVNSYVFPLVTASFNTIDVGSESAPAFTDLDGNGLLDMLVGKYNGTLSRYEQLAVNATRFGLVTAGFNAIDVGDDAAPAFADLDGDGLLDMLVGKFGGTLSHYEQSAANGTTFTLVTASFNGFGLSGNSAPAFTDLDGDGLLDMLVGKSDGTLNHYEQSAANSTAFTLVTAYFNNIDVGRYSAPTFCDLDGDGLLDMVVGAYDGTLNHYEQNAANSAVFTLVAANFNGINVGYDSKPAFTDLDGDGLLDMVVGEEDGNLNHYEQVRPVPTVTSLAPGGGPQGSTFVLAGTDLTGTTSVLLGAQPAPFVANSATQLTVTVPPGGSTQKVRVTTRGGTALSATAFGVNKADSYSFPLVTAGFNAIDVGDYAAPAFADLDGDGLLDMVVGNQDGTLRHYEQSAANSTTFALVTANFNSIDVGDNATPTFVDLDGNGLLDMLVSKSDGKLNHYEQNAVNSLSFSLVTPIFGLINVNRNATPTFVDLDGDGLLDIVVGKLDGTLRHHEQRAANGTTFTLVTDNFNSIDVGDNATPTFVDLDGDGLLDMLVGKSDGTLRHYEQSTANSTTFALVTASFNTIDVGDYSAPAFTDLDGDGLLDMLVGKSDGTLVHYEQAAPAPTITGLNPANGPVGSTLSLTGTGLTGATAITFNGTGGNVVTAGFTVNATGTGITGIVVPAGAVTGPLTVTSPNGTSAASPPFTVCRPTATGQNASFALGAGGTASAAASAFDAGSSSPCGGALQATVRKGGEAFGRVAEGGTLTLTAPAGYTFTAVDFASYGTPGGTAGSYALGSCHATASRSVVETALLGQTGTVSIAATNTAFGGDPCGGTGKFLAVRALYTASTATGGVAFGSVAENGTLTLTAPAGTVFTAVNFASYGTPTGSAGSYTAGSCEAATSRSVVAAILLGQTGAVSIDATNTNFGDPCGGTGKSLAVRATYAPGSTALTYTCTAVGPQPVLLTLTDAAGATATTAVTATVSVPALTSTTWTGAVSTDWTDCQNWSYGLVPATTIGATLPAGLARYPTLPAGTYAVRDLTLASGAGLTTAAGATLQVNGDWTNNGGTATLNGGVAFTGAAAQTIGGSADTAFGAVTVSKASGALGLGRALAIGTSLTLTSGILSTGSNAVTLGSSATLTESSSSYVTGTVQTTRALATANAAETFGGLGLTLTPHGGTLPGPTAVTRVTGTPLAGAGSSQSVTRYFDIVPTQRTGLNVDLVFAYRDAELNGIAEANLALFKSETGTAGPWAKHTPSTADATANTVSKAGIGSFSVWTLGNAANPLPVELTAFTAEPLGANALLRWATASEKNNDRFEVEASADGRTFRRIGQVPGPGSSPQAHEYQLVDLAIARYAASPVYYRLRQMDLDGTFSYSPVRTVAVSGRSELALFPNPTTHATALTGAQPGTVVTVFDAIGRQVTAATADATGTAALVLPQGLATGVYLVRVGSKALRLTVE